jgi:hypothetical protein
VATLPSATRSSEQILGILARLLVDLLKLDRLLGSGTDRGLTVSDRVGAEIGWIGSAEGRRNGSTSISSGEGAIGLGDLHRS